jgi:hypothetical protein
MKINSMKLSKTCVVPAIVAALSLSSVLGSLAQAGSINYEGISSIAVENDYDMQQHRGLILNFSFGGAKDYKKKKSVQDMQKANLDRNKTEAYAVLIIAVGVSIITWTR